MTTIRIGYSPCPNDTFIMAALARKAVKGAIDFRPVLADVETLNQWAVEERLDVTKLSFTALGQVRKSYGLLYSGGALGRGCGPLVVARPGMTLDALDGGLVAAPGALTTARLLLSLFHGRPLRFKQMVFSDIMPAVSRGDADFGLVIHEGRFTFAGYGLEALLDLGSWWEKETGLPIPLGGIAIRRDIGPDIARKVDEAIRESLGMAYAFPEETMEYVLSHAQEMDPEVVKQHIELYVNSYSRHLGAQGQQAVEVLLGKAEQLGLIPGTDLPLAAYCTDALSNV